MDPVSNTDRSFDIESSATMNSRRVKDLQRKQQTYDYYFNSCQTYLTVSLVSLVVGVLFTIGIGLSKRDNQTAHAFSAGAFICASVYAIACVIYIVCFNMKQRNQSLINRLSEQ